MADSDLTCITLSYFRPWMSTMCRAWSLPFQGYQLTFFQYESHPVLIRLEMWEYFWHGVDLAFGLELWADPMVEGLEGVLPRGIGGSHTGHNRSILAIGRRTLLQSHGWDHKQVTLKKLFFFSPHWESSFCHSSCTHWLCAILATSSICSLSFSSQMKVQNNLRHMTHFHRIILQHPGTAAQCLYHCCSHINT